MLNFISEETLSDLRTNYDAYKINYHEGNDEWFDEYFKEEGKVIISNIPFEVPVMNMDKDYSVSDKVNVKIIYDALKLLSPSQATQERLWAGLAHLQLREYSFYRLEKELNEKNNKRINTALFFKNGNKRSLFVHIIARLWWVGYMTYDEENKENPYWLTEFFTESDFSGRCILFFSSDFTSNRNITKGILSALLELKQRGIHIRRDHFVQANKYFNIVGGAMILDTLTTNEVKDMTHKHLERIFEMEVELV